MIGACRSLSEPKGRRNFKLLVLLQRAAVYLTAPVFHSFSSMTKQIFRSLHHAARSLHSGQTATSHFTRLRHHSTQISTAPLEHIDIDEQPKPGESSTAPTGSAKLFEDAEREELEAEEAVARQANLNHQLVQLNAEQENWTGEESVKDAVLRMLVDKYKPLRGSTVQTADEKLHAKPPTVSINGPASTFEPSSYSASQQASQYKPDWRSRASEPLIPAIEGHRPWHTTYVAPGPTSSRIRTGAFSKPHPGKVLEGDKQKVHIATRRSGANAQRLGRARESTLDYRLGTRTAQRSTQNEEEVRPAMIAVGGRGWASLVEEKIEVSIISSRWNIF